MCMTKREKALSRFYGEIKKKFEDNPEKGLKVMEKVIGWADEHTEKEMLYKEKKPFTKKIPKYSVDTIKEKAQKEFPELVPEKKQSKEEEVINYFKELVEKKAKKEEEQKEE